MIGVKECVFMDELTNRLRETLEEHCRLATTPVAIKLVKEGDTPKQKAKYPLEHVGTRMAVCQGMTIASASGQGGGSPTEGLHESRWERR